MDSGTLERVRVVLVGTTHSGNIGAVARAMRTMGLHALHLVAPRASIDDQARAMAAGGEGILDAATIHPDLRAAVADCVLVVGTSARARGIGWPALDPAAAAEELVRAAAQGPVAVVFGPERSGLSNHDLDLCRHRLEIPANPEFPSLNLAAAVQIVAYEIFRAGSGPRPVAPARGPEPRQGEIEALHAHTLRTLAALGFYDPEHPRRLARRLRELVNRANPDQNEVNMLRGVLAAIDQNAARASEAPKPDA